MKIFQRGELEMNMPSNPVRISLFFVYSVYVCLRVGLNSWNDILPDWDVDHVGWWYLVSCSNRSSDLNCVPGVQLSKYVFITDKQLAGQTMHGYRGDLSIHNAF